MSIGNLMLSANSVAVSYLVRYGSFHCLLLQNAAGITTKCDSYFITKCNRNLLQNASRFFIRKCDSCFTKGGSFYKLQQFYYKIRQLLQNATFITTGHSQALDKYYFSGFL